jgi:uncharacterized Fe-S cluster-containing MiaB family protein
MDIQPELKSDSTHKSMVFHFRFSELGISKPDIIENFSESNGRLPDLFLHYIDEVVCLADEGCRGSAYVWLCSNTQLDLQNNTLTIENVQFQINRIIAGQIRELTKIAVFVCTAGSFLEDYASQQMRIGNYPEAFIADHLGSLVVETAMDNIQEQLRTDLLREDLKITNRF